MDHENYGRSSQTQSNSDIASGAQDIKAGVDVIAKETGAQRFTCSANPRARIRVGVYAMLQRSAWIAWCWEPSLTRAIIRRR